MGQKEGRSEEGGRGRGRERERERERCMKCSVKNHTQVHTHTDYPTLHHCTYFIPKFVGVSLHWLSGSWVGFGIH